MYSIILRCALYGTLGVTLDALAVGWLGTFMVLALCLCCDHVGRIDGRNFGAADGIRRYLSMTEEQQAEIRKMVKQWEKDA